MTPRRLTGLGCLVALCLAAVFAVVLYQQIRNLFRPTQFQQPGGVVATQDVPVERGSIADGVRAYGVVRPAREAALGFRLARGKVAAVPVQLGQLVEAGELLVEIDATRLESDLAKARADLLEARKKLEQLSSTGDKAQQIRLELDLHEAKAALDQARRELAASDEGRDTPQEKHARAGHELANARAALIALRESEGRQEQIEQLRVVADRAQIKHGEMVVIVNPSEEDRDVTWLLRNDMLSTREAHNGAVLRYEMDLRAAVQRVALAERALRTLEREIAAGSPAVERARRVAAVRAAQAAVQQAQARLDAVSGGVPDVELAKAQAQVLKLEGALADAEAALDEARLVAPFAGIVDEITVAPDALVSGPTAVVTLVDVSAMTIVARFSDIDVVRLQKDQEARVSFDAFRGQEPLAGRLGEIPLYGRYEGGLTLFEVPLVLEASDLPFRPGMSVNVFVPLEQKENVLLVPAMAMQYDGVDTFVLLVRGNRTERRKVRLGAGDGLNFEVLEGLQEGDVVRMPLQGPIGPGMYMGGYG